MTFLLKPPIYIAIAAYCWTFSPSDVSDVIRRLNLANIQRPMNVCHFPTQNTNWLVLRTTIPGRCQISFASLAESILKTTGDLHRRWWGFISIGGGKPKDSIMTNHSRNNK